MSAYHLLPLLRVLQQHGLSPHHLLERVGIKLDVVAKAGSLHRSQFLGLALACMQQTGDESLGLHAGELAPVDTAEPTFSWSCLDALSLSRDAELIVKDEGVIFRQLRTTRHATPRVLGDYFAARTLTLVRCLAPDIRPVRVRFMHPRPQQLREYLRVFAGAQLSFGEEANELQFSDPCEI